MQLEGKTWKKGKFWLIEVPELNVMTQGKSKSDALKMIKEAITLLIDKKKFKIMVIPAKNNHFFIRSKDSAPLLALLLKRQRVKHRLSIKDVASKIGARSKNAYAQYEQGKSEPSLTKIQQLLEAIDPESEVILKVA